MRRNEAMRLAGLAGGRGNDPIPVAGPGPEAAATASDAGHALRRRRRHPKAPLRDATAADAAIGWDALAAATPLLQPRNVRGGWGGGDGDAGPPPLSQRRAHLALPAGGQSACCFLSLGARHLGLYTRERLMLCYCSPSLPARQAEEFEPKIRQVVDW